MPVPTREDADAPAACTASARQLQITDEEMHAFQALVRTHTGIHLDDSKRPMLVARLGRRLRHHGLTSFAAYHHLLAKQDPDGQELAALISRITTNITRFFREPHHFDFLRSQVFPAADERPGPLRIWSCAASTGEEPYSIAMTARDHFGPKASMALLSILATDIDTSALATATRGVYDAEPLSELPPTSWQPHFLKGTGAAAGQVRVCPGLRDLVTFQRLNLIDPHWPDLPRFDVIFCRNVIIYFDQEARNTLIRRLVRQLRPGGYLVLGHSENLPAPLDPLVHVARTVYQHAGSGREDETPSEAAPRRIRPAFDHSLQAGDVLASREPTVLRTVLGSCVAACLYDPEARIGGMNHFALPNPSGDQMLSSRYGVHAMEVLINEIMKLGGDRRRLRAKVFGACEVLRMDRGTSSVAAQNAAFITEFLATEGLPLVAQRLGGQQAVEVLFHTGTGQAQARTVGAHQAASTLRQEAGYQARMSGHGSRSTTQPGRQPA